MYFPSYNLGAPTSSNGCSPRNLKFYTAPSSDVSSGSNDDEFEFVITTRRFANRYEFQQAYPAFWWTKRNDNEEESYRLPARAKSFCSGHVGHVLPLRPPPGPQTLVSSSPRSPNSLLRIPFSRPCAWNDDFDPFQFALEKVSDETRARMSFHRRSHSYSSYRTSGVSHWLDGSVDRNKEHHKQGSKHNNNKSKIFDQGNHHMKLKEHLKPRGPTLAKMMAKESLYSRRAVHSEPISKPKSKSNPMAQTKNGLSLGKRPNAGNHKPVEVQSESSCCTESKIHRIISLLFKSKKNSNENRSWKLRRCLGYAPRSPPFMK